MTGEIYTSYLQESPLLDFHHTAIKQLIKRKGWMQLSTEERIREAYNFVRDEIEFGYNASDTLKASEILADGYGQCNTKGTLLMALLRALGIPCRFHGFTIFNALQKGAIPAYLFPLAPERIIHSWVEILFEGHWYNLEGFIIDKTYLEQIQKAHPSENAFQGYGIATPCLKNPPIEWQQSDTYIQKEGIADDFGVFNAPDDFYRVHGANLKGIKRFLFRYVLRHLMNLNVKSIRNKGLGRMSRCQTSASKS